MRLNAWSTEVFAKQIYIKAKLTTYILFISHDNFILNCKIRYTSNTNPNLGYLNY